MYKYFEGEFHALPDFARLRRGGRPRCPRSPSTRRFVAERFAVVYDAWLVVPEDGVVRFVARADDGVRVDVDGVAWSTTTASIASRDADRGDRARARPAPVRVGYFQGGRGKELSLSCEGPTVALPGRAPSLSP